MHYLNKAQMNRDPEADPVRLLMNVSEDIKEYVGDAKQFDDITMLAFQYNGNVSD